MAPRYLLKVGTDFAAAHSLRDYPGECSRLHGHNWKVEVEVAATELDAVGIGMDFKTIKSAARALAGELDHRYLNELEPFARVNPTAENIAAYFYRRLSDSLNTGTARIHAVTLWETDNACVRYTEDNAS